MEDTASPCVKKLIDKGVTIPEPATVHIGNDVDLKRISGEDVIIYPGSRILGKKILIMKGARLGQEGPVTIEDCQIGPGVELKGGYFRKSTFLKGSNMALGAHVRDACILEEEASCAHNVGLKHTILFPYVTLGSLINFCDCLMAGGTSRKDHSEVGSSYIHFNFTPSQDKATASLIGDVPRGVMLNQRPIFLGGQGGLVGPSIIEYGTVIAAGVVFRGESHEENKLITNITALSTRKKSASGLLLKIKGKVRNNINYIANIIALKAWYSHVRSLFAGSSHLDAALLEGALEKLDMAIDERIARLEGFIDKFSKSQMQQKGPKQEKLFRNWNMIADMIHGHRSYSGNEQVRDAFLAALCKDMPDKTNSYIITIKSLPETTRKSGTAWLNSIVQEITKSSQDKIPSLK